MATGRGTKLTGAVGEFLVAAELCRRGLIATPFSGNVPHYDIVASDEYGGHLVIQVKAMNKSTWQFDASKFIKIAMDGDTQVLGDYAGDPYPNLYCVFVALGDTYKKDRYFVFSWKQLQAIVIDHHRTYLKKHGGIRPKAPKSTHCSISIQGLKHFEDEWFSIEDAMTKTRYV